MNIREAINNATTHIPHTESRQLLAHLLDVSTTYLVAHDDVVLTAAQRTSFNNIVQRRAKGEPLPYILGTAPFRYLDLAVTPAVLIPRPDTELLVDHALKWIRAAGGESPLQIVDVGTGSGCIPIALATELVTKSEQLHTIYAVDVSLPALTIARQNAQTYNANITFHHASLLAPFTSPLNCITANLPYITDAEWTDLDSAVKLYEPTIALRGGADGLDLVDDLLQQATTKLAQNGAIFLEIGWQQGQATVELAKRHFPQAHITCYQDYGGRDRIIAILT